MYKPESTNLILQASHKNIHLMTQSLLKYIYMDHENDLGVAVGVFF